MISKSLFIILISFISLQHTFAQGNNCLGAQPFCSDQSYTFPASTNTTAQNGPDYDCLSDQPNPAWYYLQIANSGNLEITLSNSQNEDIDFICWGPFSSPTAPCTNQLTNNSTGFFGCLNYPCGNTVDCSYSSQATEIVEITNANVGEYYILLITNFSGNATDISAQQTGGSGSTDCSIVDPCIITSVTASVSTCNATNNQYTVNGTIAFTDPPTTGQLIVEDCSGVQLTYNAPFGTTQNYNFTGLNANGTNCSITAYFTDDITCSISYNYIAPAACMCNASAGTTTVTINGQGTNNYVLCDGDEIDIQSNNDYLPPLDHGIINGASYAPGLGYAVYFCPPTPNTSPINDPCFTGFFTGTLGNFTETNSGGTSPLLTSLATNGVSVSNNTIYLAPVSLYNGVNQAYDDACYHVGSAIEITYLQPITTSYVESCINNETVVTLSGSYPSFNASNFTLINTMPSNVIFSSTSIANGGFTTLTGFNPGDNYSFDITDNNGCTSNFSSGPFGGINVETYDTTICIGGTATLTPNITGGTVPFTYSWDNGTNTLTNVVTPLTDEISCLTVTDNDGCSSGVKCFTIDLHPELSLTMSNDTTICKNNQALISSFVSGGIGAPYTYIWDNGLGNTNLHTVNPLDTTTYNVTIADGCETPTKNGLVTVNVIQPPIYSFTADEIIGCPPLEVTFTPIDVPTGYSLNWSFGNEENIASIDYISHLFNIPGCWDVTLDITSPEGCVDTNTLNNYICINQPPFTNFEYTPLKPTVYTPTVEFNNETENGVYYEWSIVETNDTVYYSTEDIIHVFPNDRGNSYEVCLVATDINSCSDLKCKNLVVLEDILLYLPNSFTPNGDLLNDLFIPSIIGAKDDSYVFQIYNKWGTLIFETSERTTGWDGYRNSKLVKSDVYVWKIQATDLIKNEEHQFIGHVNLIK